MATQRTLTYEIGGGIRRRLLVSRCNPYGVAAFNVYTREGNEWLRDQKIGKEIDEGEDELSLNKRFWVLDRAQCLAALAAVYEAPEGSDDFAQVDTPAEWATVDGFLQDIPATVFDTWAKAAREVNPGLWAAWTDEEKNAVAVTVE